MKLGANDPWSEDQELLLKSWSEQASCFRWLHSKSANHFNWYNNLLTIPSIVLSTVSGSANFLISGRDDEEDSYDWVIVTVGCINMFCAVLTSVNQFMRFGQKSEGHKKSAVAYGAFRRSINIELSMPRGSRQAPAEILEKCKTEMDRLAEMSDDIPSDVLNRFNKKFEDVTNVSKPDITNGLHPVKIHKDISHKASSPVKFSEGGSVEVELSVIDTGN